MGGPPVPRVPVGSYMISKFGIEDDPRGVCVGPSHWIQREGKIPMNTVGCGGIVGDGSSLVEVAGGG